MHRILDEGGELVLSSRLCSVIGTTAALIVGGLAAAGAVGSAVISNQGIKKAASATQAAADTATAEQKRQFDINQANQAPYLETGKSALEQLAGLYGIGPQAGAQADANFYKSPDYQFRFDEGIKGQVAASAASGSLDSGDTIKAATKYAGNLASGEFSSYANRLANLAGIGQTAANTVGAAGSQYAQRVGEIGINQADNKASSYGAKASNYGSAIKDIAGIGTGLIYNNPGWFGGGAAAQQPAPYNMNWG